MARIDQLLTQMASAPGADRKEIGQLRAHLLGMTRDNAGTADPHTRAPCTRNLQHVSGLIAAILPPQPTFLPLFWLRACVRKPFASLTVLS